MPHAIRVHEAGGPEVLEWEEVDVGEPGPGQVRFASRRRASTSSTSITAPGSTSSRRRSRPGVEGAGVVEAVGPGVSDLKPGDRVAYGGPIGGYAEVRLIPADRLVKLPDAISSEQAAAMMLQGMTAEMLLRRVYSVKAGDTILVHAAAGGVGLILCQWAKALGATVIGTVGSDEKAELVRAHGCDHPIVYTRQDFVAEVARITGGAKVPVVYDGVGRDTFMKSLDCLARRGMMVSFGNASGPVDPFSPRPSWRKRARSSSPVRRSTIICSSAPISSNRPRACSKSSASGKVKIEVKQRFPLRDAAEAHRALEARKTSGSTVFTV